jgi:two-component system sensor histidine kinase TtrS
VSRWGRRVVGLLLFVLGLSSGQVLAEPQQVKIGVLSHRGDETALRHWSPTADYLGLQIPEKRFVIIPLDFDEIDDAIAEQSIDFLLVNPGIYVSMEVRYRISRIATMNNLVNEAPLNTFAGVLFTRKDSGVKTIDDMRGRSFMAVDRISLGGFQMAWRELKHQGLDIDKDLASFAFAGTHDEVVRQVASGRVDVGTVRTGILASMAASGEIDLNDIHIINEQHKPGFPLVHSTSIYPEWPFSKLQHTPNELAQQVVIALLKMSELEPAAQWGDYAGWTVPLEYQPVHDLLKELELPPYDWQREFTLTDVFMRYSGWVISTLIFILVLIGMTLSIYRLHRELEKSKRLLEQQHTQILNSVADGIYGVDLQGNSTFVNRAMEQITGWRSDELIGLNQHELLHHTRSDGSPHPAEECPVFHTFVDSKPRYIEEDLFWKKDGSSFPVEYSSNPIRDDDGKTVGSVVVFRDISLKKKSQEAARQYQLELAHVARLSTMGEMASGLAHELNQPLTAIGTNADACIRLLEAGHSNERVIEVLEKIGAQARHAGEIIRHLRRFVRKEQPEQSRLNLNRLVDEVLLLIMPEIEKAGVSVRLDLRRDLPDVMAQHIHIDQVLLNLMRNAIEAMSANHNKERVLTISTMAAGNNAVVTSIADTGPGISDEIMEKLFTPFMTTKQHGMGLGLSLSQGIIAAHKGVLYVHRTSDAGTVFRFSLPVKQQVAEHV